MAIKDVLVVRQMFSFRGVMQEVGAVISDAELIAEMLVEHAEKVIRSKHEVPDQAPAPEPQADQEAESSVPSQPDHD